MTKAGILIEIENNLVKETSLGVMAAANGQEIYAFVLGGDAAAVKDKLAEYEDDKFKVKLIDRLEQIKQGERDLYF